jgi:hypothetical protein
MIAVVLSLLIKFPTISANSATVTVSALSFAGAVRFVMAATPVCGGPIPP